MKITTSLAFCQEPGVTALQNTLRDVLATGANGLLILACAADGWTADNVDSLLVDLNTPVFGGIFPYVVHAGGYHRRGTLVVGLKTAPLLTVIEHLSQGGDAIQQQLETAMRPGNEAQHFITLVDGLAENIEVLVSALYSRHGQRANTVGCGAGNLEFQRCPCLFSNRGLLQDAAVIASFPIPFKYAASHGWEVLQGPYLVTASDGNALQTLNYAPAFDIYRTEVEKDSGLVFGPDNFFEMARTYPLGIENLDGEILVRDPIQLDDKALICVGQVPENATVYLLRGDKQNLIDAAGCAAKRASHGSASGAAGSQAPASSAIVFDCISRAMFLNDSFTHELQAIEKSLGDHCEAFGALTLGEICTSGNGPVELLNKSTVIAVF